MAAMREQRAVQMNEIQKRRLKKVRTGVPQELTQHRQWVAWRGSKRDGRPEKIPIDPKTGNNALVNDPATWASFEEAIEYWEGGQADGVGFVLTEDDPFVVLDLDACRDPKTADLDGRSQKYLQELNSYAEVSPSGAGVHVWLRGTVPHDARREGVEIYSKRRFITMTGRWLHRSTPEEITAGGNQLRKLWEQTVGDRRPTAGSKRLRAVPESKAELDRIIEGAHAGPDGTKFRRLWNGNVEGFNSQSEADLALCRILALHAGCRRALIDELFRRSALFRGKWSEVHDSRGRTYGEMTISKALNRAMDELKAEWGVQSADEIGELELAEQEYLIEGLIPRKAFGNNRGPFQLGQESAALPSRDLHCGWGAILGPRGSSRARPLLGLRERNSSNCRANSAYL